MKDTLISILGLPEGTAEEQILAALSTRLAEHAEAVAEIGKLRTLAKAGGLPKSITPELLEQKLRAGLDKGMAIDVLLAQADHDAALAKEAKGGKADAKEAKGK